MSQEPNGSFSFNSDSNQDHDQNKNNIYLQIATPKSPNSDGFSPTEITDDHHHHGNTVEDEIKQNVVNQIDIEILLKHREYNLVQNEISKVQNQMDTLQKLHDDPQYSKYIKNIIELKEGVKNDYKFGNTSFGGYNEPSEMITRRHSMYGIRRSISEESPKPQRTSYGGLRPVLDSQGNKICVHKRSDGVIVKIECPTCARSDFGSAQGFLNHSRLAHQIEYKSQDHAALVCGTILPEVEQDDLGITSIKKLKESGLDPDNNLAPGVVSSAGGSVSSNTNGATTIKAEGDDLSGPQKKKARRSVSKPNVSSGYLEKLYSKNSEDAQEEFKEIYQDATTTTEVEFEDPGEDELTTPPLSMDPSTTTDYNKSFKKGHNRRKSRGGLSAVTFEDDHQISSDDIVRLPEEELTKQTLIIDDDNQSHSHSHSHSHTHSISSSANNQNNSGTSVRFSENSITFGPEPIFDDLTPSQKRRFPTVPNPLRTRSRSSRENSN